MEPGSIGGHAGNSPRRAVGIALLCVALSAIGAGGRPSSYNQMSSAQRQGMQAEVKRVFGLLGTLHYRSRPLVGMDSHEMIDAYLRRLDPMGIYFLASDETFIHRRFGRSLKSSYLLAGDIYPAYEIFDLFRERFEARQAWVQERLNQPFDLSRTDSFSWDRRESGLCKNAEEADAIWEAYLTAALISKRLLNDDPDWAVRQLRKGFEERTGSLAAVGPEDIEEDFLNALLLLQDPHSGYDSWDTLLDRDVEMSGTLVGIGADLKIVDGAVVVDRIHPGGAADLSGGLRRGEHIVAVGGDADALAPLAGLPLQEIVGRIRGEAGTKVALQVAGSDSSEPRVLVLERTRIELGERRASATLYSVPVSSEEAGPATPVGVIDLPSFYGDRESEGGAGSSAGADVGELLGRLAEAGAQAVVLDLRGNPGGYNQEAVRVTGQFLDTGTVFVTKRSDGVIEPLVDKEDGAAWRGPLVVLTSNGSASAAEVTSGALHAYRRAVVVGSAQTFGKGTSQVVIPLGEGMSAVDESVRSKWGSLRITAMRFYLPDGNGTQAKGVAADIVLPGFRPPHVPLESDLPGALPWDGMDVPEFAGSRAEAVAGMSTLSDELLEELRARHASRAQAMPEIDWLNRRIAMWAEYAERSDMLLNLDAQREIQEGQRAASRALREEGRRMQAVSAYEKRDFRLASVEAQAAAHRELADARQTDGPGLDRRVGRLIDDVYYHQAESDGPVVEVEIPSLDLESYIDDADTLVSAFSERSGLTLTSAQLVALLADRGAAGPDGDETLMGGLAAVLGVEADSEKLRQGVEGLMAKIIEIDPSVTGSSARFDVTMREALRIAADWHVWELNRAAVGAKQDPAAP